MPDAPVILVVDDDPRYLELLTFGLEAEGFTVYGLTDPWRTVSTAVAVRPDVIVMDVAMPEMDGFCLAAGLKSNAATADIPLIFASALDAETNRRHGHALGAVEYITKPFSLETLCECIRGTLARPRPEMA